MHLNVSRVRPPDEPTVSLQPITIDTFNDGVVVVMTINLDRPLHSSWPFTRSYGNELSLRYNIPNIDLVLEGTNLLRRVSLFLQAVHERSGEADGGLWNPHMSEAICEAFLQPLADIGWSVFRRLFILPKEVLIEGVPENEQDVAKKLIAFILQQGQTIAIRSHAPLFPWAFLYDQSPHFSKLNYDSFWGFKHEIQEFIPGPTRKRCLEIESPALVAAICPVASITPTHLTFHTPTHPDPPLFPSEFNVTWLESPDEMVTHLKDFNGDSFYFFGHHQLGNTSIPSENLVSFDNTDISVDYLDQENAPRYNKEPVFIYINGCSTAPLQKLTPSTLLGLLVTKQPNKVCCVATSQKIPAVFGAKFAERFWAHFGNGKGVGYSMLQARLELLKRFNNPLGLLYVLFGKIDFRITGAGPVMQPASAPL